MHAPQQLCRPYRQPLHPEQAIALTSTAHSHQPCSALASYPFNTLPFPVRRFVSAGDLARSKYLHIQERLSPQAAQSATFFHLFKNSFQELHSYAQSFPALGPPAFLIQCRRVSLSIHSAPVSAPYLQPGPRLHLTSNGLLSFRKDALSMQIPLESDHPLPPLHLLHLPTSYRTTQSVPSALAFASRISPRRRSDSLAYIVPS
jgi:hypothetical protein